MLCQPQVHPQVLQSVEAEPGLLWRLLPHEEAVRANWRVTRAPMDAKHGGHGLGHLLHSAKEAVEDALEHKHHGGKTEPDALAKIMAEHSMGSVVKEIMSEKQC